MMFSSSPFDFAAPRSHRRRPSPQSVMRQDRVEPEVRLMTARDEYVLACQAPEGHDIRDVQASLEDAKTISMHGILIEPARPYEYIARRRTGVYASPGGRQLVAVLPAGARVRGGPPSRQGWIALDDEDDESWILDDGSLALVEHGRPPKPSRFTKRIALPSDADAGHATTKDVKDGCIVTIPRKAKSSGATRIPVRSVNASPCMSSQSRSAAPQSAGAITKEKLFNLQMEYMCDDLALEPEMLQWTEQEARQYFESGGLKRPGRPRNATTPPPVAQRSSHGASSASTPAATSETFRRPSRPKRENKTEANKYDVLASRDEPILVEVTASITNVQVPAEQCQEWEATKWGGFVRTA